MKVCQATQRDYQYNFSAQGSSMFDQTGRLRKARTMVSVLQHHLGATLSTLSLLNLGGSTGIIDSHLAEHFLSVTSIDIDQQAITYAQANFSRKNLQFAVGDAMAIAYPDNYFDIVICSQVYEHVPNATQMMNEIHRVLKPGGICYFAAGNRLMWNEPHYNLPLLSVMPHFMADIYLKLLGKGTQYYERHLTYWGLSELVTAFKKHDYTTQILQNPEHFSIEYMLNTGSKKAKLAAWIAKHMIWLVPGYIWLLEK